MIKVDFTEAENLAANIRAAHVSIDDALFNLANLATSMISVCRTSEVPPAQSQAAIEKVTSGLQNLAIVRKDFVAAHRRIVTVQDDSNFQETNFGCVGPKAPGYDISGHRADLKAVA